MSMQSIGEHDENGRLVQPSYEDGRTKQSFKDETDINKILHRAQKAGTLSHLDKYEGVYGDFSDYDFMENQLKMTHGREVFDALPSEIRDEFRQSPAAFFAYVNDPANAGKLREKLPALAAPGRQNIDVSGKAPPGDASEPPANATNNTPVGDVSPPPEPPTGSP